MSISLRLQQYPRGLGKGSDAALVSKWIATVLEGMDENQVPDSGLTWPTGVEM